MKKFRVNFNKVTLSHFENWRNLFDSRYWIFVNLNIPSIPFCPTFSYFEKQKLTFSGNTSSSIFIFETFSSTWVNVCGRQTIELRALLNRVKKKKNKSHLLNNERNKKSKRKIERIVYIGVEAHRFNPKIIAEGDSDRW